MGDEKATEEAADGTRSEAEELLEKIGAKARELEEAVTGAGAQARTGARVAAAGAAAAAGLAAFWARRRRRGAARIEIHRF